MPFPLWTYKPWLVPLALYRLDFCRCSFYSLRISIVPEVPHYENPFLPVRQTDFQQSGPEAYPLRIVFTEDIG